MKEKRLLLASVALALVAPAASAQEGAPTPEGPTTGPGGDTQIMVVPGPSQTTTTYQQGPGHGELDGHLPSSSQSLYDINSSKDTFDLNRSDPASATARGGKDAQYVIDGSGAVPQAHSVRRGDTLWGLSGQYYKNPYAWPRLWSYNPQIQNPHWIYPGDRVRLRTDEGSPLRRRTVPEKTIFLRDYGWVDDIEKDKRGEVVGSPEDQMYLTHGDNVYIELEDDEKVELGQELTIFREVRTMRGREADAAGELVSVIATVRVDRYNPKTHLVRAEVIESLDAVERGDFVGKVGRKFLVVPPTKNEKYLEARILTALYPHQIFAQSQVVFLDRGAKHGVKPGNRFIAVRRGDRWVESLPGAGASADDKAMTEDDRDAIFSELKTDGPEDKYPNETFGEIRVLATRDRSSIAIVTESSFEIERDTILVMKKGY
jgi:hypothetical protein